MKTVSGGTLVIIIDGNHEILLKDKAGNGANMTVYTVLKSNGVLHVIYSLVVLKI